MAKTMLYQPDAEKPAKLIIVYGDGHVQVETVGAAVQIGRRTAQRRCEIEIDAGMVSRVHGEIACVNGSYYYRDLESTNGTYVNSRWLHTSKKGEGLTVPLKDGDMFCFSKSEKNPVYAIFTTSCEEEKEWGQIELGSEIREIQIGRSGTDGVRLDNPMISEKHASFFQTQNGWAVIDHESTNGVYVNGKRITIPKYIYPWDVIRIAGLFFILTEEKLICQGYEGNKVSEREDDRIPALSPAEMMKRTSPASDEKKENAGRKLVISIEERSVVQRFKKLMLLQNINISVNDGEMVLILGGSGAGKTTFINAVMGYEKAQGTILHGDTDIYEEYEQMKHEIGFVPQKDLLRGSDSVYNTLQNAADMKLPRSMSAEKKEQQIEEMLNLFGLSRERDSLVSKLSGGQKKRLSIAVEFISNPSLFFLDEPDSGIDDVMGRGLMENLRKIADMGKIVMLITHSPERAADLYDKVIVLAKSVKDNCGHLAFYGSVEEAFDFFEVKTFREIVRKINRPDENGEGLSDYFIEKYEQYRQ